MAYVNLRYGSYNLGMETEVCILLPENRLQKPEDRRGKKYPVLYLLHGHSDDNTGFLRKTKIEVLFRDIEAIVVMPNANRSFYTNMKHGHYYEDFIAEELPQVIESYFPASSRREDRFVAGYSMGGYGAFKLALKYPDRYAAAASMSGAFNVMQDIEKISSMFAVPDAVRNMYDAFGSKQEYEEGPENVYNLARQAARSGGPLPRLFACCGLQDSLLENNRELRDFMQKEVPEIPFEYKESNGTHNWYYWDNALPDIITFLGYQLHPDLLL